MLQLEATDEMPTYGVAVEEAEEERPGTSRPEQATGKPGDEPPLLPLTR